MTVAGATRLIAAIAALCLAGVPSPAELAEIGFRPVELDLTTINTFGRGSGDTSFGVLEFRSGLEIASSDADFGGFSGLDFAPDGSLVAVADTGFWLAARLIEDEGRLVGLADARIAPILDANGKPVAGKSAGDAESLRVGARDGHLEALVSFERQNDLRRFVAAPDLAHARAQPVRLPKSVSGLRQNAGLEALAVAPERGPFAGATVLLAERSLDANGNHRGWIVDGPRVGGFSLMRRDDFDVTDAVFLPDSDLLVLERRFSLLSGPGMRIRRIAATALLPGDTVDGRILIEADMRHQIDNMEGIALRPGDNGETLITLISDDNKSPVQRTLLLEFALPPDAAPTPRMRHGDGGG